MAKTTEVTVVETEEKDTSYTLVPDTPLKFEDKEYEELHFEWSKLTGYDSRAIENEIRDTLSRFVLTPQWDNDYLLRMAARACREAVDADALMSLNIKDYNSVTRAARNFLSE